MTTEVYTNTVPLARLGKVQKKVEKMNRRAEKLGLAPFKISVEKPRIQKDADGRVTSVVDIAIIGETIKIDGYTLIAKVEHGEEGNLIKSLPGVENAPVEYRTALPNCGHCGRIRARKTTYVLKDKSGEYIQIGSTCMHDFVGHSANEIEWLIDEIDPGDEDDWFEGYSNYDYDLPNFLTHVAAMIRIYGWTPKSADDGTPTVYLAVDNAFRKPDMFFQPEETTEADKKAALDAIEWAKNQNGSNDFIWNISQIARAGFCSPKDAGLAAAIVSAHQKHLGDLIIQEKARKEAASTSSHIGQVGERLELTLTVTHINSHWGNYGETFITKLVDEDGNQFTWFTNKHLVIGAKYTGKATIKKHEEYRGVAQTVITRYSCREVDRAATVY